MQGAFFMDKFFDIAIIGGGAAGLFFAARVSSANVCVFESEKKLCKKLAVTGGGKCNFSNRSVSGSDYASQNPHFALSALSSYSPADFCKFLDENHLAWEEKEFGRLFLKGEASVLCALLEEKVRARGVNIFAGTEVLEVKKDGDAFLIKTRNIDLEEKNFRAKKVVVSAGGLALYGSDAGLGIAESFGLKTVAPEPALCPLIVDGPWHEELAGISVPVKTKFKNKEFSDGLIFTHNGLGGPAVYQISLFARAGDEFEVDFLPRINVAEEFARVKHLNILPQKILADYLPKRLASFFAPGETPLSNMTKNALEDLVRKVKSARYKIIEKESYRRAEVMSGGVDTRGVSGKTMESKVPGLYFIGECLDVTGRLGGYNLHWAWASAAACARSIN